MPKAIKLEHYLEAISGFDVATILKATKEEASRQVGNMLRFKEHQEMEDPDEDLWIYESDESDGSPGVFALIKKAEKFRALIYDRNKAVKKKAIEYSVAETMFIKTQDAKYKEEMVRIKAEHNDLTDEQVLLAWKIMKVFCVVNYKIKLIMADSKGEGKETEEESMARDPFAEHYYEVMD